MAVLSGIQNGSDHEVRGQYDRQTADDEAVDESGDIVTDARQPVRTDTSGRREYRQSEKAEPQQKLWERQHDDAPEDPFCEATADQKCRSAFQPQSDAGENQRHQSHRRQKLDQETNDVGQYLWSRHANLRRFEDTGTRSGESVSPDRAPQHPRLRNASGSLQNPELEQSCQAGHSKHGA